MKALDSCKIHIISQNLRVLAIQILNKPKASTITSSLVISLQRDRAVLLVVIVAMEEHMRVPRNNLQISWKVQPLKTAKKKRKKQDLQLNSSQELLASTTKRQLAEWRASYWARIISARLTSRSNLLLNKLLHLILKKVIRTQTISISKINRTVQMIHTILVVSEATQQGFRLIPRNQHKWLKINPLQQPIGIQCKNNKNSNSMIFSNSTIS